MFGLGLGLGFRDRFRVRIRLCLVVWVNPGQGGLDGSRKVQCPLGPKVLSDVPDYRVLQQYSPSVERARGGSASSFSAQTCNFLRISEMSLAERLHS